MSTEFLVTSRKDMEERGWDQLDFVYVNGDAYVDHPGFAAALIGRMLEARGYREALFLNRIGTMSRRLRFSASRAWVF